MFHRNFMKSGIVFWALWSLSFTYFFFVRLLLLVLVVQCFSLLLFLFILFVPLFTFSFYEVLYLIFAHVIIWTLVLFLFLSLAFLINSLETKKKIRTRRNGLAFWCSSYWLVLLSPLLLVLMLLFKFLRSLEISLALF